MLLRIVRNFPLFSLIYMYIDAFVTFLQYFATLQFNSRFKTYTFRQIHRFHYAIMHKALQADLETN